MKFHLVVKENEICRKGDRSAGYYVRQGGLASDRQTLMLSLSHTQALTFSVCTCVVLNGSRGCRRG